MMMKRGLSILLAGLLVAGSLTACGKGRNNNTTADNNTNHSNTADNNATNGTNHSNTADNGSTNHSTTTHSTTTDNGSTNHSTTTDNNTTANGNTGNNLVEDMGDAVMDGAERTGDALTGRSIGVPYSQMLENGRVRDTDGLLDDDCRTDRLP